MTHVERSIEVAVPVRTAYDQWTQFEDFPRFMAGVQEVKQIGDALTHWVAEIAGVRREWDAAILEQVPDHKVAWAATTGATNAGAVYFKAVGDDRTQVRLTLDYEPEGLVEKIGDFLDVVDRQAVADLDRFKEYIEKRGTATGGWRGEVDEGDVTGSGAGVEAGVGAGAAVGAAAGGGRAETAGVSGDVVAVGPTGGTHGTVATEAGSVPGSTSFGDGPGVGHSGDPIAVDTQRASGTSTRTGDAGTAGPTADAAASSPTGVAGFGTDTGLSSDDPASGVLTGNPGATAGTGSRTEAGSPGTAGPTAGAAASSSTGVAGFGTDTGLSSDDPASGVVTGDPGARTASHAGSGTGDLTAAAYAEPGVGRDEEWGNEPGVRSGATEAATDPVGESWAAPSESGVGETRLGRENAGLPAEDRDVAAPDVVQRDFANRDVRDQGDVQRDFANREITEQDIANRGITDDGDAHADVADKGVTTGMGGAQPRSTGARAGIEGETGFLGSGAGTADDPEDPQRPGV